MVDANLLYKTDSRPLRYMFLDLNAYFASVEQQEHPELRGRPVGVVPMMVDSTCILASSYEAKRCGVKTGTNVAEARRLCPDIHLMLASHGLYVHYHDRIVEAAESVLPVDKVRSVDEMQFKLIGKERDPLEATAIAKKMKQTIREKVGDQLTCSVGVAPNAFLAKIGTELQKPDGLVVLNASDLPERLYELGLTDFTGINRRMAARLNAVGIFTAEQMCTASPQELARGFGSVIGERWWYLLRGFEINVPENARKSLGHSHILPPELRTDDGCKEVLLRLIGKAAMRMRREGLCSSSMDIYVSSRKKGRGWSTGARFDATNDTVELDERFIELWKERDFSDPLGVGVTFHNLATADAVTPSLFAFRQDRTAFNDAVDCLNRKFGKNTIYLAGMDHAKDSADEKIAFGKTSLLSEGKGDNEWVDSKN